MLYYSHKTLLEEVYSHFEAAFCGIVTLHCIILMFVKDNILRTLPTLYSYIMLYFTQKGWSLLPTSENLIQEEQFESHSRYMSLKSPQTTKPPIEVYKSIKIFQLWEVITVVIILSFSAYSWGEQKNSCHVTVHGTIPGMCACMYLIGHRSTLSPVQLLVQGVKNYTNDVHQMK